MEKVAVGGTRSVRTIWSAAVTLAVVAGVGALATPSVALAAGDANEARCGAETEAALGFRAYLPDCRAFELVTPPYKEGGIVIQEPSGAISEDGSRVIVGVAGAFAGADNYLEDPGRNPSNVMYELMRGASGWQPTELTPAASEYPESALLAVSAENFEVTLWGAQRANPLYPYVIHHENIYLRTGPGPSGFHPVGPGTPRDEAGREILEGDKLLGREELGLVGASRDLTRSLYRIVAACCGSPRNLWEGDTTEPEKPSLYEYVYAGAEDPEPTLVGVRNDGTPPWKEAAKHVNEGAELISDCGTELGSGGAGSAYNAVSASGEVVFFTALECEGEPAVDELYARVAGEQTVAISEPSLPAGECSSGEPCFGAERRGAIFQGASENGERVFFSSEQPLVNGASAGGMKLYEARLEGAKIAEVVDLSADPVAGQSPEVQGVVRVSEDGERVYFVAEGQLTGLNTVVGREPEETGPEKGADNLYVYEPEQEHPGSYHTVFVATLLKPSEEATLQAEEKAEGEEVAKLAKAAGSRAREEALSRGVEGPEASEIGTVVERQQELALSRTLGPSGTRFTDRIRVGCVGRPSRADDARRALPVVPRLGRPDQRRYEQDATAVRVRRRRRSADAGLDRPRRACERQRRDLRRSSADSQAAVRWHRSPDGRRHRPGAFRRRLQRVLHQRGVPGPRSAGSYHQRLRVSRGTRVPPLRWHRVLAPRLVGPYAVWRRPPGAGRVLHECRADSCRRTAKRRGRSTTRAKGAASLRPGWRRAASAKRVAELRARRPNRGYPRV